MMFSFPLENINEVIGVTCHVIHQNPSFSSNNEGDLFFAFRDPKHSPGGELVLGGTDPNYYTGNFNYMDTRETGKWEVTMKG